MDLIQPITITDSILTSTNVTEDDYTAWDSGTAYVADDYVIIIATHLVWKCIVANTNKPPADNIYDGDADPVTGYWTEVSATNAWKMFDGKSRAATSNADSIEVEVTPGELFNSLALLNVKAETVTITVTDPTEGVVYSENVSMVDNSEVVDFYTWFFGSILRKKTVTKKDLPAYREATVAIEVTETGATVEVGELVVGQLKYIGKLLYGYSVGIRDYSVKEKDDDGNAIITEGIYSDTGNFSISMKTSMVYYVKRLLASYRATPLVFIGYAEQEETIIYGFYTDFDVTIPTLLISYCTIEVEELS